MIRTMKTVFQSDSHVFRCLRYSFCSDAATERKQKMKLDHLTRTANQFRQNRMYKAIVHKVEDLSETIRSLTVKVSHPGIHFKAGQWVDFYIPNVKEVVGYSMTSPPYVAESDGVLDLAVRYSIYPPTYWIHKQCHLGDVVTIRVGGEFHYDPQPGTREATADVVLIGGGVGINPMASIAQQYAHIVNRRWKYDQGVQPGKIKLLYSARDYDELVFRDLFLKAKSKCSSLNCKFFVTRDKTSTLPEDTLACHIGTEHLREAISDLSIDNLLCYICGPSTMIDAIDKELLALGVNHNNIKYEKWWEP